jgi:hypothetical protein
MAMTNVNQGRSLYKKTTKLLIPLKKGKVKVKYNCDNVDIAINSIIIHKQTTHT